MQTAGRYRGDHDGRSVEVELVPEGRGARVVLHVDGRGVAEGSAPWPSGVRLESEDLGENLSVVVRWWLPGRVLRVALVEKVKDKRPVVTPLEPPADAPGAALARFEYDHPRTYAARHVVAAVAQVLIPLLGLSFGVRWLFGWLPDWNLPSVDLPDLPDIPWPDLPNLWGWLPDIDLALPPWVREVMAAAKWVLPILIALYVARTEVNRRRRARSSPEDDRSSPTQPPS